MKSPEERLTRLLDRHPEFYAVGSDLPSGAIIRRREMIVAASHASTVEEAARRWTDRRDNLGTLGLARFTMHRDTDVADLIATQLSPEGQDALAAPVHMFRGEPNYQGGPGDAPSPVADPPPSPGKSSSSHGVTIAILDTGINVAHSWFSRGAWEAVDPDVDDRLDTDNDYELDAQAGHGTFIAGIVRQHAPGAHLSISRVLGSDGVCDEVDLLQAINALRGRSSGGKTRIGVLNLSLGAYTWNDRPPALLSQAIEALGADTVVVAAAGNNASDRLFWPAAFDSVVGVGALAADGRGRTSFSNHGVWVDAWAPGDRVASSFVSFDGPADQAPNADIDSDCFTGFATWSGTSFAAPRIAAELARRAQEQKTSPRQVLALVLADFATERTGASTGPGGPG
ncbi:MAG: S8/S53 family peptidase [Sporichthyaceae bacterium]